MNRIIKQVFQNGSSHVYIPHVDFQNGTPPTNPVDTDMQAEPPVQNLFDWDFQTVYLRSEEISTHTDISHLLSEDDPLKNVPDDEFLRVDRTGSEITALSIVHKSHIFEFGDA